MKGRELRNAALEVSHAVYRDAKISLDLSRQSWRWRLELRVVGTSRSKKSTWLTQTGFDIRVV